MSDSRRQPRDTVRSAHLVRRLALVLHRYVGLFLVLFLTLAGLTGSVLAFQEELDEALSPELFFTPTGHQDRGLGAGSTAPVGQEQTKSLDPFVVARRTQPYQEGGVGWEVPLKLEPGKTQHVWQATDRGTYTQQFVDPETGVLVGQREWGNLREGKRNLIPFLYKFHYSLALGEVGTVLFGIAALLWTLDCFVGAYLTTPSPGPSVAKRGNRTQWFRRWVPAWLVRANSWYAWIFTWHRASGLWVWGLLLVFAWSGVGFNLWPIYRPVMAAVLDVRDGTHDELPELTPPFAASVLSPEQAYEVAKQHMQAKLAAAGAELLDERALTYAPEHGAIVYRVKSTLDIQDRYPRTEVYLDSKTGELIGFDAPTGQATGNTVTNWIFALHMGTVGGLAYRILVAVLGVMVAVLSVSGVLIWLRKANKRASRTKTLVEPSPSEHASSVTQTKGAPPRSLDIVNL